MEKELTAVQRAKANYKKSEKGKACEKRYREKNKERRSEFFKEYNAERRRLTKMYKDFYEKFVNEHPDYEYVEV